MDINVQSAETSYSPKFDMGAPIICNHSELTQISLCREIYHELNPHNTAINESIIANIDRQIFHNYRKKIGDETSNTSIKAQLEELLGFSLDSFPNSKHQELKLLKLLYKQMNSQDIAQANIIQMLNKPSYFNIDATSDYSLLTNVADNNNGKLIALLKNELKKEINCDKIENLIKTYNFRWDTCIRTIASLLDARKINALRNINIYLNNIISLQDFDQKQNLENTNLLESVYLWLCQYQCRIIRKSMQKINNSVIQTPDALEFFCEYFHNSDIEPEIIIFQDINKFMNANKKIFHTLISNFVSAEDVEKYFKKTRRQVPILIEWCSLNSTFSHVPSTTVYAAFISIIISDVNNETEHMTYYGATNTRNQQLVTDFINKRTTTDRHFHVYWAKKVSYLEKYVFSDTSELMTTKTAIETFLLTLMINLLSIHDFDTFCNQNMYYLSIVENIIEACRNIPN